MRAAVYARYSSNNQREASIEDQVELCRRYIERQGWQLAEGYADRALSGASDRRPAYRQLIADAEHQAFDVVVTEHLDRLGRKLADVAALFDRLEFQGIGLHAVNLGQVTTLHVGLLGTMAQLYLSDLKDKTRRGQLGRALAGKIPGGKAYGYDLVEGETGGRTVNQAEAAVVWRIFQAYADGRSPRAIARQLNAESVPGPEGREWRDTTIRGQVERGTGILNNALYAGRLEWNRCSYVKDPRSGKRVARPNPRELWEIVELPELQIVDKALWDAVKQRQQSVTFEVGRDDRGQPLNRAHRRRFLFSGLLRCGLCGGGYTIMAADRYGCATRRTKGTCANSATILRKEIEARVLAGLKEKLMAPELVATFVEEFQAQVNQVARDAEQRLAALRREAKTIESKIAGLLKAIEDGMYTPAMKDRMAALETRRDELERELRSAMPAPPLRLHPGLSRIYRRKVEQLEAALNDDSIKAEAAEVLRALIDWIELVPRADGAGLDARLHGELAAILAFCDEGEHKEKLPGTGVPGSQLSVVAGARTPHCLTLPVCIVPLVEPRQQAA
ncbi:MAG: recombinase family protein [Kiloniellales bacterium]